MSPFPKASRLGFGCASLGSRISVRDGLRALDAAFASGVNWFDVAPSYGDGEAEVILGQFARGKRDALHICTKCGIAAGKPGAVARIVRPLARSVVRLAPQLRSLVARGRSAAVHMPITPEIVRESLDRSLTRLGVDHVDVLALHDPSPADVEREEIHRALEDAVISGKARAIGVAGSVEAVGVVLQTKLPVGFLQFAAPPFEDRADEVRGMLPHEASALLSTHSVFGRNPVAECVRRAGSPERLLSVLQSSGYVRPVDQAVRAALLDFALKRNPDGIVLVSMLSGSHMASNIARVAAHLNAKPETLVAALRHA